MSVVLETGTRATTNAANRGTRIAENANTIGVSGARSEAAVISFSDRRSGYLGLSSYLRLPVLPSLAIQAVRDPCGYTLEFAGGSGFRKVDDERPPFPEGARH